jgi:hypothetical protein
MRFGNPCDRWMRMDKMSSSENVRQRSPMSIRATTPGGGKGKARMQLGLRPSSPPTMAKASQFLMSPSNLIASFFPWPALNQKRQTTNDIPFSCFWYFTIESPVP